ncbi:Nif3-like dinuclear metal center hexameric protein [Lysinibacillus sphaericus]
MEKLSHIVRQLDETFKIKNFGKDPAFSRYIPQVYEGKVDWRKKFEPEFNEFFNGLMIKGSPEVKNIYLAVFPTIDVLERFIEKGESGDLLFMHHPLLMECGDPNGKWGRGFVPIGETLLDQIRSKGLSVYTCHIPMDYHETLGTSQAMAEALNVDITERFIHEEKHGYIGIIGDVHTIHSEELSEKLQRIFDIPYVDFEGQKKVINKVAVVAGCGDKTHWMQLAEEKGADAYISGEIHCHIDNNYGRRRFAEVIEYADKTSMSLFGVSHSASEYLVKKTLMAPWFEENFDLEGIQLIPQRDWWL